MRPVEYIDELKKRYRNTDIDWELILEHGYRLFLDERCSVIEVGAHAGRHTDVFANDLCCESVLVFEPLPAHVAGIRERYLGNPRVRVVERALGRETGTRDFVFNTQSPEESGLRERVYNDPGGKHLEVLQVEVATLDTLELGLERIDYVKIDTEGGEIDILRGAAESLRRYRPILSIEYGEAGYAAYGNSRWSLYDLAVEHRYVMFDLFGHPLATPDDWWDCVDNFYWDYYMVPAERAEPFHQLLSGRILATVPQSLIADAPT